MFDCSDICKRGTATPNRDAMREQRCGYASPDDAIHHVERDTWHLDGPQGFYGHGKNGFGGVPAYVCPQWYVEQHGSDLYSLLAVVDSGLTLTRSDPAVLIDAAALFKRTREQKQAEDFKVRSGDQ